MRVRSAGPEQRRRPADGHGVLRAVLRSPDLHRAVPLTAVVGAVAIALDPSGSVVLRGLVWAVAGAALLLRAEPRPEPTPAIRLLGVSNLAIGVAWLLVAGTDAARPAVADLRLLTLGVLGVGVATLVSTPTWRHRTSLLDGVVLALAGVAPLVVIVDAGSDMATGWTIAAVLFATLLGPSVLLASLASRSLHPAAGSLLPALGLGSLLHAGTATATAALSGSVLSPAAEVTWLAAPVAGLLMAVNPMPSYVEVPGAAARRPGVRRLAALYALALVPAVVTGLAPGVPAAFGLLVSLLAALLVGARVAASAQFDLEDAAAAADVRFDALVEHAAEVLALLDGQGRLFYVSQAVLDTFHVPPERVLGTSPAELAHPDDVEAVEDLLARVGSRPGVPLHARLRLLDGHGAVRHVDVTVVDLRHVDGVNAVSLTVRDVTERVALEAELVRQARTDGLTGLATRTVLLERVDHVMTAREPRAALLFLDLDDFKLVNDGFGHAAGDEVLAVLASRLRGVVRSHDTAGRVGGDEFAILLEELGDRPVDEAVQIAERILQVTAEPIVVGGEPLEVRVSVGIALPDDASATEELFAAADAAMYEAKRDKRGVVLYEPGMRASSRSRLRLMRDVRSAIDEGTLEIGYQPIVDARTGELAGAEALLRWRHPSLGDITPDIILDHADAAGLTAELTRRIVDTIAADLTSWRARVGRRLDLAINLSAQQLVHIEPEEVLLQLLGGPDAGGSLTIEITETSMLGDLAAAARVLDVFRDAGCHVAIDDFGTGYASIGYLRRLPLDKLKIDREFIDGLSSTTVDGSFAQVIQGLATALHLTTIAEGVETEDQLAAVHALGCDYVQGFLFGRPVPMEELVRWTTPELAAVADPA